MRNSAPNWSKIFALMPELESPGYQEASEAIRQKRIDEEREKRAAQMQQINKEKQSQKNKNRSMAVKSRLSQPPSVPDPLLGSNKRGGKKR